MKLKTNLLHDSGTRIFGRSPRRVKVFFFDTPAMTETCSEEPGGAPPWLKSDLCRSHAMTSIHRRTTHRSIAVLGLFTGLSVSVSVMACPRSPRHYLLSLAHS